MSEQPPAAPGEDAKRPSRLAPAVTTQIEPRVHATLQRGIDVVPASEFAQGRFGRMFRQLPVFEHDDATLGLLAALIVQAAEQETPPGQPDPDENPSIPAGYTYLGQFIDHDITFDPASSLQRQNDPDALHDFRTPRFDLDSVYGRGPADQPYLYENGSQAVPLTGALEADGETPLDLRGLAFLLGETVGPGNARDLPRNSDGRALIGDPRNDENLIVSQLQCLFLSFHNRMVARVADTTPLRKDDLFKETQRLVRWHYQWIVVHDFLPRIAGQEVVDDILQEVAYVVAGTPKPVRILSPHLLFYDAVDTQAYMPVEFSAAAYRFGHSMVRPGYFINDTVREARASGTPQRLPIFSDDPDPLQNLNGFRPLPKQWGFDWKYFFPLPESTEAGVTPQSSYKIDDELSAPLGTLPLSVAADVRSLALRNLLRGKHLDLPAGQTVARAMGIEPLTDDELETTRDALSGRLSSRQSELEAAGVSFSDADVSRAAADLIDHAPLWYYVLKEAQVLGGAEHLGPVGGRIVAEVLIGLLQADPLSFLSVQPAWRPIPPIAPAEGTFTMADLIAFSRSERSTPPSPTYPPASTGESRSHNDAPA